MLNNEAEIEIPADILENWQEIANILAEIVKIPAALIMRYVDPYIEVFISSDSEGNPYHPGEREVLFGSGLYCETVIKTQDKLLVPDALADANWRNNPDVKLNMISYLGFPLLLPNKEPFGTLCVLDTKANKHSQITERLMLKFHSLIESELKIIFLNQVLRDQNNKIMETKRKLREANHLYRDLTSRIPGGVYALRMNQSGERIFEFLSDPMCDMLDINKGDALGASNILYDRIHPDDRPNLDEADRLAAQTLQPFHWEGRFIIRGEIRWVQVQSNALKLPGDESLWNGILIDITDQIVQKNELQERACTDDLTGLLNRRQFIETGDKVLKESTTTCSSFVVAMIDIDYFKAVNDTYGHSAGDIVLIEFSQLAKNYFRSSDIFGRIGGEEFGIVLRQSSSSEATNIIEHFRMTIAQTPIKYQDKIITISISCGICPSAFPGDTFLQLLNKADQALYKAKELGRNQVVVFS